MSAVRHRVHQPGNVLDGYVLQDGDCPFSDADPSDLNPDDGGPEGSLYCGFADDERMCCGESGYTAWICGMPPWPGAEALDGVPVALCAGHAEVVRGWVELLRMHTVRAAGTTATWRAERSGYLVAASR